MGEAKIRKKKLFQSAAGMRYSFGKIPASRPAVRARAKQISAKRFSKATRSSTAFLKTNFAPMLVLARHSAYDNCVFREPGPKLSRVD